MTNNTYLPVGWSIATWGSFADAADAKCGDRLLLAQSHQHRITFQAAALITIGPIQSADHYLESSLQHSPRTQQAMPCQD